ncbi:hypothetical protein ABZ721_33190 [Streptomyces sp. NPDC006733]|uniref:hypothetical protein n=1 Tax=Streptomyces sp. NPDC006733 TaxID=3155460 RepID=UPI0033D9C819
MADSDKHDEAPKGRSRSRRPQQRAKVQNDVLRQSMADAISGSFLNAGTDSTAALLAQMSAPAPVAEPAAPEAAAARESSRVVTAEPDVPETAPEAEPPSPAPETAALPGARSAPRQEPALPAPDLQPAAPVAPAPQAAAPVADLVVDVVAESAPVAAPPVAAPAPVAPALVAAVPAGVPDAPSGTAATRKAKKKTSGGWAHAALQESFLDNRINSQGWETWGFRLVPDVKKRLEERLAEDKRSADNRRLAQGHYVNAAMLHLPDSVDEQLEMIREFVTARGGYTDPGKPSNYRVSQTVWQVSRDLDMDITAAAKRGLVVFLFSAAVERFLDSLDAEGTLARPEIFRRVQ